MNTRSCFIRCLIAWLVLFAAAPFLGAQDCKALIEDVRYFLENPNESTLLTTDNIRSVLSERYTGAGQIHRTAILT
jgi:hypothetical protein